MRARVAVQKVVASGRNRGKSTHPRLRLGTDGRRPHSKEKQSTPPLPSICVAPRLFTISRPPSLYFYFSSSCLHDTRITVLLILPAFPRSRDEQLQSQPWNRKGNPVSSRSKQPFSILHSPFHFILFTIHDPGIDGTKVLTIQDTPSNSLVSNLQPFCLVCSGA